MRCVFLPKLAVARYGRTYFRRNFREFSPAAPAARGKARRVTQSLERAEIPRRSGDFASDAQQYDGCCTLFYGYPSLNGKLIVSITRNGVMRTAELSAHPALYILIFSYAIAILREVVK